MVSPSTTRFVRVSSCTQTWVTSLATCSPVTGSVASTLSPTRTWSMGFSVPSAINTAVAPEKLEQPPVNFEIAVLAVDASLPVDAVRSNASYVVSVVVDPSPAQRAMLHQPVITRPRYSAQSPSVPTPPATTDQTDHAYTTLSTHQPQPSAVGGSGQPIMTMSSTTV